MHDTVLRNLDVLPVSGDPGDDTASRYRYQSIYAAILCCALLDETEGISEVFCEHHEDVLIKYTDGMYSGVQIKTRAQDQAVWKASDPAVKSALSRFAKLEDQFPCQFRAFHFLTNHPLYSAKNGKSLPFVLENIKLATSLDDLSSPIARALQAIAREATCSLETAFGALRKTMASHDLPKLTDIETRLVSALSGLWARAQDCTYTSFLRAARHLSTECWRASSLAHQDVLPAYLPIVDGARERELVARIEGKRIDRSRLCEILEYGLNETAQLAGDPQLLTKPGAGTKTLLLAKLEAGGFSVVSCNSALDLRDKADYLGLVWTQKYGQDSGLQRYGHIQSLVLSDTARAFENSRDRDSRFGLAMLAEFRKLLEKRRTDGSQLYDCSNEHLEGIAYSLTAQCKVQWSVDRPWEVEP